MSTQTNANTTAAPAVTPQPGTQQPNPPPATPSGPTSNRGGRGRGRGGRGGGNSNRGGAPAQTQAPAPAAAAPAGNRTQQNKNPTPTSSLPSITGWGTINVSVNRNETRERFQTDCSGFMDLVHQEYSLLQRKHNSNGRLIPWSLFKYYCCEALWKRILHLKSKNDRLTSSEREALRMLENHHLGLIPERLHQYLMSMGNFTQGGCLYDWHALTDFDFSGVSHGTSGFFNFGPVGAPTVRTNPTNMWFYSFFPVPGVLVFDIQNELSLITNDNQEFRDLDEIRPLNANQVGTNANRLLPSPNILGRTPRFEAALHSSWRSTFTNSLRWARDNLPPDTETNWLISPTTLRWVADRLASIPDWKGKDCSTLTATTAGHPMQMYWFEPLAADLHQVAPPLSIPYSQFFGQGLHSPAPVPADWLSPAFAFMFRVRRSHSSTNVGLSSPWYPIQNDGTHVPLTVAARLGANVQMTNAPRSFMLDVFSTVPERRSRILPHLYQ
uniref:Coat protein n=1 Tax=Rhizoctonia solani dsRNA virus 5 TaxID=2126437 RepID=A0A2P1M899_9VIRU|nr:coat protein [Rhizoctonia solani dsRNA virus 5]